MADPRFYRNLGPFSLASVCAAAQVDVPEGADGAAQVRDLAGLDGAGPQHLSFFSGGAEAREAFASSKAGVCLVPARPGARTPPAPDGMIQVACPSVGHAWAAAARLFYPDVDLGFFEQENAVSADAVLGEGVRLGPGVKIGPGAEIGAGTRIGAGAVIGPGVAIGRDCEIGANAVVIYAYLGDRVTIFPGVQIGHPGFGYIPSPTGHTHTPQLGRVIIQDAVDIGAGCAIDRGALGDTVIGEGTKFDNLIHIAHNVQMGRHCLIAGQVAIAGSAEIGDFVFMGGQVGIGDHSHTGPGARLAARTGVMSGQSIEGGRDYGGIPAKPLREFFREMHTVSRLARRGKRDDHE